MEEALRRIRLITPMLRQDVGTAVASHSVMEACNDVIPPGMKGIHTAYNDTYGIVQNALALKLAMDIARIFDVGQNPKFPPETQDKASVQVLAALFRVPGVQERLEAEASNWLSGIEDLRSDGVGGHPLPKLRRSWRKSKPTIGPETVRPVAKQ